MSIVIRTKRQIPAPIADKSADPAAPRYRPRPVEAPDAGYRQGEASESRIGRHYEAPDAGEGRAHLLENHFTHGRSRS